MMICEPVLWSWPERSLGSDIGDCKCSCAVPESGAIYLAGGDCARLSRSQMLLELMADGVREGFGAVHALGRPVRPFALNVLFTWLPRPFAVHYWRQFFSRGMAELVFARHARRASAEMQMLATECRTLLGKSGVHAPALDRIYLAIEDYVKANELHSASCT